MLARLSHLLDRLLSSSGEGNGIIGPATRKFAGDQSGSIILLFGLMLVPLLGFVGGAIDYGNAFRIRSKLQSALDAATLAAGREFDRGGDQDAAQKTGQKLFEVNLGKGFPGRTVKFNIDSESGVITATSETAVDTYLLGVIGIQDFRIAVRSSVTVAAGKLEIVLVLDNSGSMRGSRLRALKAASKKLTKTLFLANPDRSAVKISVVPFAASVNVDPGNANARWMDTAGLSSIHFENFDQRVTRFDLYGQLRGVRWNGCVEVRPEPYDVTDSAPIAGDGDMLFVPMFAPDEPDRGRYSNNYLSDNGGACSGGRGRATEEQVQEKICKYKRGRVSRRSRGPNYLCDSQPLTPLNVSQDRVIKALDAMRAEGRTNIHEGVMWGWRVLSPDEPFTEGRPYEDTDNKKFMIVMTDGANTHSGTSNQNMSDYSAYGYAKHGRLTRPTRSTRALVDGMNDRTEAACTNAKARDIVVYTIAFNLRDRDTVAMLERCASGSGRAFSINNGDGLIAVFEAIAGEINSLRITS